MKNTAKSMRRREIYVCLPNEAWRPTQAEDLGNGLYKILPLPGGVPKGEVWEFPPGSIVRGEKKTGYKGAELVSMLVAVKP